MKWNKGVERDKSNSKNRLIDGEMEETGEQEKMGEEINEDIRKSEKDGDRRDKEVLCLRLNCFHYKTSPSFWFRLLKSLTSKTHNVPRNGVITSSERCITVNNIGCGVTRRAWRTWDINYGEKDESVAEEVFIYHPRVRHYVTAADFSHCSSKKGPHLFLTLDHTTWSSPKQKGTPRSTRSQRSRCLSLRSLLTTEQTLCADEDSVMTAESSRTRDLVSGPWAQTTSPWR